MAVNTGFEKFDAKMRAEDLPDVAIDTFRYYHDKLLEGATGVMSEADLEPVESLPDSENLSGFRAEGEKALAKTVVLKLNGGLGTSMGLTKAKSLLPVKDDLTFLDVIARQVLYLRKEHGVDLPLVLMNSFRTREDSLDALHKYDGLQIDGVPLDFLQHKVPKIRVDDKSPVDWPKEPENEWCPPGHGDIYTALLTSGTLETLLKKGYEYAFVSNSDNLGAVLDLEILGWFASDDLPFLMEVADRTEADKKGGHLAKRTSDGQLVLREVAQTPDEEMSKFQDISRHKYFNTNTLWVNLKTLARVMRERDNVLGLPLIVNKKTVDPTDDTTPEVFQLETAMGAAISVFDGARAIRVPRERFVPVKTTNDLLGLWSDVYVLSEDQRVMPGPSRAVGDLVVDLDPRYFKRIDQLLERFPKGPPSLVNCRRLVVKGDFRFGVHCVFLGEVEVENLESTPRVVPDGEVFD